MDKSTTSDEEPKRKIARRVVTANRKYFLPATGQTVEAETADEAVRKLADKRKTKEVKDGDAN